MLKLHLTQIKGDIFCYTKHYRGFSMSIEVRKKTSKQYTNFFIFYTRYIWSIIRSFFYNRELLFLVFNKRYCIVPIKTKYHELPVSYLNRHNILKSLPLVIKYFESCQSETFTQPVLNIGIPIDRLDFNSTFKLIQSIHQNPLIPSNFLMGVDACECSTIKQGIIADVVQYYLVDKLKSVELNMLLRYLSRHRYLLTETRIYHKRPRKFVLDDDLKASIGIFDENYGKMSYQNIF